MEEGAYEGKVAGDSRGGEFVPVDGWVASVLPGLVGGVGQVFAAELLLQAGGEAGAVGLGGVAEGEFFEKDGGDGGEAEGALGCKVRLEVVERGGVVVVGGGVVFHEFVFFVLGEEEGGEGVDGGERGCRVGASEGWGVGMGENGQGSVVCDCGRGGG